MKIYTRTGDEGLTGLYGGGRVRKHDLRIAAAGAVDELNAQLGVCRAASQTVKIDETLARLQHEMFALGAELASAEGAAPGSICLDDRDVAAIEAVIDAFQEELPPLNNFVLPGGALTAATIHVARSVCRRAERDVTSLAELVPIRATVLQYLNRVSDLLFVLARYANRVAGVGDVHWEKKSNGSDSA